MNSFSYSSNQLKTLFMLKIYSREQGKHTDYFSPPPPNPNLRVWAEKSRDSGSDEFRILKIKSTTDEVHVIPLFSTDYRTQLKEMADKRRAVTFNSVASTKTHRFIPLVFQHSLVVWCWKIPEWLVEVGGGVAIYNYCYSACSYIIIRIQISSERGKRIR
jgi:hypothetical protein